MKEEIEVVEDDNKDPSKVAILRKALVVGVMVFFCSLGMFIGLVILIAKWASKTPGGN